ncbi:MAG: biotin--[acetyl-CoA-carboxylase] ligase [Deltaproteobacteria bacterium]|nr:biotin--[acetyl-CoA-carboxylase] ligase [Deltaproteobacteria bacterium]
MPDSKQLPSTKDQLLEYLKAEKGEWVSGQALSGRLSVSRSAVSKNIQRLREAGYVIESASGRGYLLQDIPDRLLPAEIQDGLKTGFFGKGDIAYFMEIDSTNARAKDMASEGAAEGTVVVAEKQTGGRGRKGRDWFSPPMGGIYCSLILRPEFPPEDGPKITFLSAVAAAEALGRFMSSGLTIKWPNDILANGKKIAGILTEMTSEMDAINYVVVGIGINVNTHAFPGDIQQKATSLLRETNERFSRVAILRAYLEAQEKWYNLFKKEGFEPILEKWATMAPIVGKAVRIEMVDRTIEGKVRGIDPDGVLIVEDKDGAAHRIISGDVFFI